MIRMNLKLLLETMILMVMNLILEVKIIVVLFKNTLLLTQPLMVKGLIHTPAAAHGEQIEDLLVTLKQNERCQEESSRRNLPQQTV